MTPSNISSCALCDVKVFDHTIFNDAQVFCCHGCQAVYNILAAKNELTQFEQNPLFLQAVKSGLISNPALLDKLRKKAPPTHELQKMHLEIRQLWCPSCAELIHLVLMQEKGISKCIVDYSTDLAVIEFDPCVISTDQIFEKITSLSYLPLKLEDAQKNQTQSHLYLRFAVAAFCALNLMMFSYPIYAGYFNTETSGYSAFLAWASFFTTLPVIGYSARPLFRRFYSGVHFGFYGMETLVILGVTAGFSLSTYELIHGGTQIYFDSIAVIIAFMLLGKIFESRAKFSAKDSLIQLNRSIPRRGRKKFPDGSQKYVPIKEVAVGDLLIAMIGEKIVLDGEVVDGSGNCDESLMTGESIPIQKEPGSRVVSGTILKHGWILYRVSTSVEESSLQKIIEMIELDVAYKSGYVRAADPIIRWFVPMIVLIALITGAYYWIVASGQIALVRMMSIFLISCPCAIGIAAPLAEAHLLNRLAKLGAIVRNRGCLSLLGKITAYVFDKTGTLTQGQFSLLSGLESLSTDQQRALKSLSMQSNHPISQAVADSIELQPFSNISDIKEFAGKGVQAVVENEIYRLGSLAFLKEAHISIPCSKLLSEDLIVSHVYFSCGDHFLAVLALGDRLRDGAVEMIRALKPQHVEVLSGDAPSAVEAVSKACEITTWKAGCRPLEKREEIDRLRKRGEIVAMVGDGINDAPALTMAHVGISMMTATEMSIQVSDILLTTDRLEVLPKLFELGRKGERVIRQNLFWAFCYNVVGVGLAVSGMLTPVFAAFAMVASSLIVVVNASRLK